MRAHRWNALGGWNAWVAWAAMMALVATGLAVPGSAQNKKNKNAAAKDHNVPELDDKKVAFDLRKIVWPNPPAIARIRWVKQFTGEKINTSAVKQTAQKQKWMDRLAGTKSQAEKQLDIPAQLLRPFGIASDSKGRVYVGDQSVAAIFIFNPETSAVEMIKNGHSASFGLIYGLAMDDDDRLFVTDLQRRDVAVFDSKHVQQTTFGGGVLGLPGGIAVDTENRLIYVVDTGNDVVAVFDADSFKLLRKIGVPGKKHTLRDPGTFSLPSSVAVDKDGNVYVTDTLNCRVEIFDADGNFISMFGKEGDGAAYFERPKGIAVDGDGHIWVVDGTQDQVKVFNQEGRLLIYFGQHGEWPGMFMQANMIAIDKQNRVYVSEQFYGRVQMFRYVTDAEADQLRKEQEMLQGKADAAADKAKPATAADAPKPSPPPVQAKAPDATPK